MKEQGIGANSCIALDIRNRVYATAVALSTSMLGARRVQASSALTAHYIKLLNVTHLISDDGDKYSASKAIIVSRDWFRPPKGPVHIKMADFPAGDVWIYEHSPGTTGTPKFMAVSQGMIEYKIGKAKKEQKYPRRCVVVFPASSAAAIRFNIAVLAEGGSIVSGSYPFLLDQGVSQYLSDEMLNHMRHL
jgi:hypothetical protein